MQALRAFYAASLPQNRACSSRVPIQPLLNLYRTSLFLRILRLASASRRQPSSACHR